MVSSSLAIVTGASLVFYAEDHSYWTPPGRNGGQQIVNVTTVLKACRISEDFDGIEAMRPGVVDFRRQLGSAVHIDCHAHDDDDLDWASVDPRVKPYVEAWATWRDNYTALARFRERRVYHPALQYCGTLDGIFEIGAKHVLVDIKTGDPESAGAQFQTSAYEAAYLAEHPEARIDERWSVQLQPEARVPYRVTPYRDWSDFRKFQSFLVTYHEQAARRRSRR